MVHYKEDISKIFKKLNNYILKMRKRGITLIFVVFLLISISNAYAQDPNVILSLKDINTNAEINDAVVYLDIVDIISEEYIYEGAVNINRSLSLILEDGSYKITLKVDLPETPGMDYFKEHSLTLKNTLTEDVFFFPVGSLRGIVKDKLDNIVGFAELRIDCVNDIEADFPETTSRFGSIAVDSMPTGSCKIFASYKDAMGFEEFSLNRGELLDIEIKLNKSIVAQSKDYSTIIMLLIILLVLAGLVFYMYKISRKEKKLEKKLRREVTKEEAEKGKIKKLEKESAGKRARDIMPTLNTKEKTIVNYLVGNKNEGSQAKIRHETGIPRTSLARVLKSLESKKIISTEKHGKLVKVKLTPWFLGKE